MGTKRCDCRDNRTKPAKRVSSGLETYMIIFHTDLDNTIIYSYKHDLGPDKSCVEIYQDREISFVTAKTAGLLQKVKEKVLIVPTTTRTAEQYNRIRLGIGEVQYALVCNGGILLENGVENQEWYEESLSLIQNCRQELQKSEQLLLADRDRCFEIRNINRLFVFTKSQNPMESVRKLKNHLNTDLVDIFSNGIKVYVIPKQLSKGMAVKRFQKRVRADLVVAAGDSEFDLPMLREADIALAPESLAENESLPENTVVLNGRSIFSEEVLYYILNNMERFCGL